MLRFVVRRLLLLVPILLGLSILVFAWIHAAAGVAGRSPLLGEHSTPEAGRTQIRHQYGLDKPIYVQYWRYLQTLGAGNFGTEHRNNAPVTTSSSTASRRRRAGAGGDDSRDRRSGCRSASSRRRSTGARGSTNAASFASLIGISIPIFFLGLILKYVFAVSCTGCRASGREDVLAERAHPTTSTSSTLILRAIRGACGTRSGT
jgi:peptide/nickel transport system permease protein